MFDLRNLCLSVNPKTKCGMVQQSRRHSIASYA